MATTITVSTASELEDALRKATGGETILLRGGNYGELDLGQWQPARADYASEVTIKSADLANPAVFERMWLRDVSNVTFDGIIFDYTFETGDETGIRPFRATGENITIRNSVFDGDIATGTGTAGDGFGSGFGLTVTDSSGLRLENNEFFGWFKGATVSGTDIALIGNDVHHIRSDGFNVVDAQGILIEGNHIHDFTRAPGTGDHADMIQLWINEPDRVTTDVTIRGNLLDVGDGGFTQSIFIRNYAVDTLGAGRASYYRNLLIEDNVILNSHHHGISVPEAIGVVIRNNTILQKLGNNVEDGTASVTYPRINVKDAALEVVIEDNIVSEIRGFRSSWTIDNNVLAQNTNYLAPHFYSTLFLDSSLTQGALPVVRPGSVADLTGAGASLTSIGSQPIGVAAFDVFGVPNAPMSRILDASQIVLAQGGDPDSLQFVWTLPDGSKAQGPVIQYEFIGTGEKSVGLEVIGTNGTSLHATAEVMIPSPLLVALTNSGLVADTDGLGGSVMSLSATGTASVLDLGQPAAAQIAQSDLLRVQDADSLSMSMTLVADRRGEAGEVVHLVGALRVTIRDDGQVEVEIKTDIGERIRLLTEGAKVNDGAAHDLRIDYDRDEHRIEVMIDGRFAGDASFRGDLGTGSRRDMVFGNQWGGDNFDGKLTAFELSVSDPVTNPYTGALQPQEALLDIEDLTEWPILSGQPPISAEVDDASLFDLNEAKDEMMLTKGVSFVEDTDRVVLDFDGTGGTARLDGIGKAHEDGSMTVSFSIDREGDMSEAARLLWKHTHFGVEVSGEKILVRAATEDEGFKCYSAKSDLIDEEGTRQITIAIDSDLDRIQIVVDGEIILDQIDEGLNIAHELNTYDYDWSFGTRYGAWFEGELTDLRIYDDALFAVPDEGYSDDALLLN